MMKYCIQDILGDIRLASTTNSIKQRKKIERKILKMNDSFYSYKFARDIEGADIKAHEKIVLDSKDVYHNFLFASEVKGADIKAHEQIILDKKDLHNNFLFARDVKGANIKAHEQIILDSKDLHYNFLFASEVKGADIKAHEQIILDSKDLHYNFLFASEVKGADIKAHEQIILDSKDLVHNRSFASDVEGANIDAHAKIILDSKDIEANYAFLVDVKQADVNAHAKIIMDSNNLDLIKKTLELVELRKKQNLLAKYNETQTLAIIKPDGMKYIDIIIERICSNGLKIKKYEVKLLNELILNEHYSYLVDKPFYPKLEEYMMSGPVAIMILEGYNAVEKLRELMGPTDSTKAPKGTIRGDFGTDITYNAIHGSDSIENAEIEINRFFKEKQKRI